MQLKDYEHVEVNDVKLECFWAPKLRVGQAVWDIHPDSIDVNGETFVHLRRGGTASSGFSRLAFEACDGLYERDNWNLSASKGYNELMQIRNEMVLEELRQQDLAKLPKWQRDKVQATKVRRRTFDEVQAAKTTSMKVTFGPEAEQITIDMLKPGKPTDDLWVKASFPTITEIIKLVVNGGMDGDRKTRHYIKGSLPKGCRKLGDKILVQIPEEAREAVAQKFKKSKKSIVVGTIGEAKKVLEDPAGYVLKHGDGAEEAGDAACSNESREAEGAEEADAAAAQDGGADGAPEGADFMMG
jgi:hypothetical protein